MSLANSPTATQAVHTALAASRDFARGLLDAIIPQTCYGCDAWIRSGGELICATCRARLAGITSLPACRRCARSMRRESIFEKSCARCKHESFWNIAGIVRVGTYDPPLRGMLLALKYSGRERNADFLAGLLADRLRQVPWGS